MGSPSVVPQTAEAVIVGGGIVGLSLAFHLAERGAGSIVVVERQEIASGATAKATGGIRQQFTSAPQVRLSVESVRFYERFAEIVGRPFPFRQIGYLFLLPDEQRLATFRQAVALQRRHGVPSEVLTVKEVVRRWPSLRLDGYAGATFCPTDGVGPPADAAYALAGRARELGVTIVEGTGMTNITAANGRVAAVETTRGRIATPMVVNAAGPWAAEVGRLAGVALPVTAHPRQVFTLSPLEELGHAFPFTVDMAAGVYVHQEPGTLLLGGGDGDEPAHPPSDEPPPLDWSRFETTATAATRWLPALTETESRGGWRGFREMTPDHLPILGPAPVLAGFWLAVGFSGHGFMLAPAVGRALADWITTGRPVDLDAEAFSPARFGAQEGVGDGAVF
jgi:sarcosine oxidase subunit beta